MEKKISKKISEFLKGLLNKLPFKSKDLQINVQRSNADEPQEKEVYLVNVSFYTDSPELVIGYHAKNLKAFRTILQTFLNSLFPELDVRIFLDIDDYYLQKIERIKKRVKQAIEEAKLLGEPVELRPMPPRYRREVHLMVAEVPGVYSESKGEGRERRVVIYPEQENSED